MDVFYSCDNSYVWLMGISAVSLFENNKSAKDLNVYLLGDNIKNDSRVLLQEIGNRYNRKITIIDVYTKAMGIPASITSGRWPVSAFMRLYAGNLLPKTVKKALYIDCDTVVTGDISPLFEMDMEKKIYGALDCISGMYKTNIGVERNGAYINAGVLLIDIEWLRSLSISKKIERFISIYGHNITYADQDILNGIFHKEIGILDPRYNVTTLETTCSYKEIKKLRHYSAYYREDEVQKALEDPKIIHFTTNLCTVRPWFSNSDHPYADVFRKYKEKSPWENKPLYRFEINNEEMKILYYIEKLPKPISYRLIGLLHSKIRPFVIGMRGSRKTKKAIKESQLATAIN